MPRYDSRPDIACEDIAALLLAHQLVIPVSRMLRLKWNCVNVIGLRAGYGGLRDTDYSPTPRIAGLEGYLPTSRRSFCQEFRRRACTISQ